MIPAARDRAGGGYVRSPSSARETGFSLVELAVALAVAGVISALVAPNFRNLIFESNQASTTNSFVTALHIARSTAISRQIAVTLSATDASDSANEWGKGWTVFADLDGDGVQDPGEEVLLVGTPGDAHIAIDSVENAATVQFRPVGIISVAPASLQFDLCDDRKGESGRRITISGTGKVSTASRSCS